MTLEQYTDIQRNLGVIVGISFAIQGNDKAIDRLAMCVNNISVIIDEIKEADDDKSKN